MLITQSTRSTRFLAICVAVTSISSYADTTINFSDANLLTTDYEVKVFNNLPATDSYVIATKPSGGNPDFWLSIDATMSANSDPNALLAAGFINNSWKYNPQTQGLISKIEFSMDRYISTITEDASENAILLVRQDDVYFFQTLQGTPTAAVWITISAQTVPLVQDWRSFNFTSGLITGGVHPNFTSNGSQLEFGVALSAQPNNRLISGSLGADNIRISISAVPEPGTFILCILGVVAIVPLTKSSRSSELS